jgi:hypothetical protein
MWLKLFLKGYNFIICIPLFIILLILQTLIASNVFNQKNISINILVNYRYIFAAVGVAILIASFYSKVTDIEQTDTGILLMTKKIIIVLMFFVGILIIFILEKIIKTNQEFVYIRTFIFFYSTTVLFGLIFNFKYAWAIPIFEIIILSQLGQNYFGIIYSWNVVEANIHSTLALITTALPFLLSTLLLSIKHKL